MKPVFTSTPVIVLLCLLVDKSSSFIADVRGPSGFRLTRNNRSLTNRYSHKPSVDNNTNNANNTYLFPSLFHQHKKEVQKRVTSIFAAAAITASLMFSTSALADDNNYYNNVLDEVWQLTNKYYIDNTFNNQNWEKIRVEFQDKLSKTQAASDATQMDLATTMIQSLGDKYSRVLDVNTYGQMQRFDLIGVGVTFMPNAENKISVGAPPIAGSAADKAGIQMGDVLASVNDVSTVGKSSFQIIDQITPNAKTVKMSFQRPSNNNNNIQDYILERTFEEIKDPIVYSRSVRSDGTRVGYVRVKEFNSLVKPNLSAALLDLENQGVDDYVLDLRGNPGGAFQGAVNVAGLFMENTLATNVVDNKSDRMPFITAANEVIVDSHKPLAIWVDKGSASASEVLTGALHDNCRGVVMGDRSFGKGLIQAVYGLENGGGLVLTVAKYVTPNGTNIQGTGITADIQASLPKQMFILNSDDTSSVNFDDIRQMQNICLEKAHSKQ